jgi:hypothetical protein
VLEINVFNNVCTGISKNVNVFPNGYTAGILREQVVGLK